MSAESVDLTLIVPACDEAERLPATLAALGAFLAGRPWRSEIVVVDDGSTDDTAAMARAATRLVPVRVVSLGVNRGKGAAVKRGVREARGAIVAFVDADLPYALDSADIAMRRLATGADIVIGGRDLPESSEVRGYTWTRRLSGKIYSWLVNALAVHGIPDTQCGFKWFHRRVAEELFARLTTPGFAFDVELLVMAQYWSLRIDRIPVRFTHSDDSKMRLGRDSIRMFLDLLRIRRQRRRGLYARGRAGATA